MNFHLCIYDRNSLFYYVLFYLIDAFFLAVYLYSYGREFIHELVERDYKNRKIGIIENGTWAPTAAKVMTAMLEKSKNLTYCNNSVKILSAMTEENKNKLNALADELI